MKKNRLVSLEPAAQGANSRVFKMTMGDKQRFAVKTYPVITGDKRRRAGTEFKSLDFLWKNGMREIARPYFTDSQAGIAVFEYIEGHRLEKNQIKASDIKQAADFFVSLQKLRPKARLAGFSDASEACFSIREYRLNLKRRWERLKKVRNRHLQDFLNGKIQKVYSQLDSYVDRRLAEGKVNPSTQIPLKDRILSPSDAGFHNILKTKNDRLVFIDFEYFGWDDPVKLRSYFSLQPDRPLPVAKVPFFIAQWTQKMNNKKDITLRFPVVCPILCFKWILILLNPFLPERRKSSRSVLARQLGKSALLVTALTNRLKNQVFDTWI